MQGLEHTSSLGKLLNNMLHQNREINLKNREPDIREPNTEKQHEQLPRWCYSRDSHPWLQSRITWGALKAWSPGHNTAGAQGVLTQASGNFKAPPRPRWFQCADEVGNHSVKGQSQNHSCVGGLKEQPAQVKSGGRRKRGQTFPEGKETQNWQVIWQAQSGKLCGNFHQEALCRTATKAKGRPSNVQRKPRKCKNKMKFFQSFERKKM